MRISSIANLLIATFAVAEALAPAFLSRFVTSSIDRITTQDTRDSVLQVAMEPLGNFFIATTQPQPISLEDNSFMTATPMPGTPVTSSRTSSRTSSSPNPGSDANPTADTRAGVAHSIT
jgi:hypothetical protein